MEVDNMGKLLDWRYILDISALDIHGSTYVPSVGIIDGGQNDVTQSVPNPGVSWMIVSWCYTRFVKTSNLAGLVANS